MADYIDTREGWREVSRIEVHHTEHRLVEYSRHGLIERQWVREAPVPPLPTEQREALWAIYDRYSLPSDVQEERGLGFDQFCRDVQKAWS